MHWQTNGSNELRGRRWFRWIAPARRQPRTGSTQRLSRANCPQAVH